MLIFEKLEQNWTIGDDKKPVFNIFRAKIPGGWLVCMEQYNYDWQNSGSSPNYGGWGYGYGWGYGGMTFIPDPNHEWDGNSID